MFGFDQFFLSQDFYPHTFLKQHFRDLFTVHAQIDEVILNFFSDQESSNYQDQNFFYQREEDGSITILKNYKTEKEFIDKEHQIYIGKNTLLESTAHIKPHTIIMNNCEIRHAAYIRGLFICGPHCVLGHTTEIKNAIFGKHVEAGHFAYIGDSILGSYINLGAGTVFSNLEFRNLEQKQNSQFPTLKLMINGQKINHGKNKFGAIIGDGCETGCNSVLSPFTFLEPESIVYPNVFVAKGLYKRSAKIISSEISRKLIKQN